MGSKQELDKLMRRIIADLEEVLLEKVYILEILLKLRKSMLVLLLLRTEKDIKLYFNAELIH
jgi:hypothetical protein